VSSDSKLPDSPCSAVGNLYAALQACLGASDAIDRISLCDDNRSGVLCSTLTFPIHSPTIFALCGAANAVSSAFPKYRLLDQSCCFFASAVSRILKLEFDGEDRVGEHVALRGYFGSNKVGSLPDGQQSAKGLRKLAILPAEHERICGEMEMHIGQVLDGDEPVCCVSSSE
jgi:hypothetical protein